MNILFFLLTTFFPTYEEDFKDTYHEFYNDDLIAPSSQTDRLLAYIHDFSEKTHPICDKNSIRYYQFKSQPQEDTLPTALSLDPSSTIIDYGAGQGHFALSLAHSLNLTGKLIAFESNLEDFKALYWNLTLNQVQNAQLHYTRTQPLDALHLDNVSLIRINMLRDETPFLRGARNTILRCKPILYLKLAGGLPFTYADKYINQMITQQLDYIHELGYRTQPTGPASYLAFPK